MVQKMFNTAFFVTLFSLSVITAVASLPEPAEDSLQQKLQIISVSKERLEANFYTLTGGIHILSEVHSDGEVVRVSITSTSGESIFAVDYPVDHSQALLTLDGSEFLVVNETLSNGETKLNEYAVPEAYSNKVKTALKYHTLSKSLLRHLDDETVSTSGQNAIERLLRRPEVGMIIRAAVALGNTGLHGNDNPSAMAFYATALRFSSVADVDTTEVSTPVESTTFERNRRGFLSWLFGEEYCSNSRSTCRSGNCPGHPNCRGLCGPGCTCWSFVCGDCCWNVGCYLHDRYGCGNTVSCWVTAPVGLICSW